MATTNVGEQLITFSYGEPAFSINFNRLNYMLHTPGVYSGGELGIESISLVKIPQFIAFLVDSNTAIGMKVQTTQDVTLDVGDPNKPYVVLFFKWQNQFANYADITTSSYANLGNDYVILGRCEYNSNDEVVAIDTTRRDQIIDGGIDRSQKPFWVTADEPHSNTVLVNGGKVISSSEQTVYSSTQIVGPFSDTTDGRVDLVYVDSTGNLSLAEGTDSTSPATPEYNGKWVIAEIHRGAGRTTVAGTDVVNITPDIALSPLEGVTVDDGDVTIEGTTTIESLSSDRLAYTDSSKTLQSVEDFTNWIDGTPDETTVSDNGDGTLTISLPGKIKLDDLTGNRLIYSDANGITNSVEDFTNWIDGTPDETTIIDNGDGTLTISLPGKIKLDDLTGDRLIYSNGSGITTSVENLTSWISGTNGKVTAIDNGNGTIRLTLPSSIRVDTIQEEISGERVSLPSGIKANTIVPIDDEVIVDGNARVTGDFTVGGTTTTINTETITTEDNIITLNDGEIDNGVSVGRSGIQIDRGTAVDYYFVFDEDSGETFRVGVLSTRIYYDIESGIFQEGEIVENTDGDASARIKSVDPDYLIVSMRVGEFSPNDTIVGQTSGAVAEIPSDAIFDELDETQAVATREDNPVSDGVPYWNSTESRFDTISDLTVDNGRLIANEGVTLGMASASIVGTIRWNSTEEEFQGYDGTEWAAIGGGGLVEVETRNLVSRPEIEEGSLTSSAEDNLLIGYSAGESLTSESDNVFIGNNSGRYVESLRNIAIGISALESNSSNPLTTGSQTAVGYQSLQAVEGSGTFSNTAIGAYTGNNLTTGNNNFFGGYLAARYGNPSQSVAIGSGALESNSSNSLTGNFNTAVGSSVLRELEGNAQYNTAIGPYAGEETKNGSSNFFGGRGAGQYVDSSHNVALGSKALNSNSSNKLTGNENVAIGGSALSSLEGNTDSNTAIGNAAGLNLTTGVQNFFGGTGAGLYVNSSNTVAIGSGALESNSSNPLTGDDNVAIGSGSLGSLEGTATKNIVIGNFAGSNLTTGSYNFLSGDRAGRYVNSSHNVALGRRALYSDYSSPLTGDHNVAIGNRALTSLEGSANQNTAIGGRAGYNLTTGTDNFFGGYGAGQNLTNQSDNIAIGRDSLNGPWGYEDIAIGANALNNITSYGYDSVAIGINAGSSYTAAEAIVAIGWDSARYADSGVFNVSVGWNSLRSNDTNPLTGSENVAIGPQALEDIEGSSPDKNTAIGNKAGRHITTGRENFYGGSRAGDSTGSGNLNTAIGANAMVSNISNQLSGGGNTAIGAYALDDIEGAASGNTGIGRSAGSRLTTGDNNVFIGYRSGYHQTTDSNLLIIDNESRASASAEETESLIYGQFNSTVSNQRLTVNATLESKYAVVLGGSAVDEAGAIRWTGSDFEGYDGSAWNPLGGSSGGGGILQEVATDNLVARPVLGAGNLDSASQDNLLIGYSVGENLTSETKNILIGNQSGQYIESTDNVSIGYRALESSSGSPLTGIGNNIAIGSFSLNAISSGNRNTFMGDQSGLSLTTGSNNTGTGHNSGQGLTTGTRNTLIGYYSGRYVSTGGSNTALGSQTLESSTFSEVTGSFNTAIGTRSLSSLESTGSSNTAIGYSSGYSLTTGESNVFIGNEAGRHQTTNSNLLIIDNQSRGSASAEETDSLIYGVFNGTVDSQSLRFNVGTLTRQGNNIPSYQEATSFPGSPNSGDIVYRTDLSEIHIYTSDGWVQL